MWCQHTFVFTDGTEHGWTINLFRDRPGTDLSLNTDGGVTMAFANAIMPLLGTGVKMTYVRVSKVDVRGDANLVQTNSSWPIGDPAKPIQQANSAVLVNCYDTTLVKRKGIYLRGVWDSAIEGKLLANPSGWVTKRDAFLNHLTDPLNGWAWRTRVPGSTVALASVAVATGNRMTLTAAADIFPAPYDGRKLRIRVTGVEAVPNVPREILVVPASATVATTVGKFAVPTLPSGGSVTVWTSGFQLIEKAFMIRPVTRRAGAVFTPSAGGRSRRR